MSHEKSNFILAKWKQMTARSYQLLNISTFPNLSHVDNIYIKGFVDSNKL